MSEPSPKSSTSPKSPHEITSYEKTVSDKMVQTIRDMEIVEATFDGAKTKVLESAIEEKKKIKEFIGSLILQLKSAEETICANIDTVAVSATNELEAQLEAVRNINTIIIGTRKNWKAYCKDTKKTIIERETCLQKAWDHINDEYKSLLNLESLPKESEIVERFDSAGRCIQWRPLHHMSATLISTLRKSGPQGPSSPISSSVGSLEITDGGEWLTSDFWANELDFLFYSGFKNSEKNLKLLIKYCIRNQNGEVNRSATCKKVSDTLFLIYQRKKAAETTKTSTDTQP